MIIECPQCNAKYDIVDEKIKNRKKLKCSRCHIIFEIDKKEDDSASKKDTAKIMHQEAEDSLWTHENLKLSDDLKLS